MADKKEEFEIERQKLNQLGLRYYQTGEGLQELIEQSHKVDLIINNLQEKK